MNTTKDMGPVHNHDTVERPCIPHLRIHGRLMKSPTTNCEGCGKAIAKNMRRFVIEEIGNHSGEPALICALCVARVLSRAVRLRRFGTRT